MTASARNELVLAAVRAEFARVYGAQEPLRVTPKQHWRAGGVDPIDHTSIFWNPAGHWHYVGLGLSELYEKLTSNPAVSGWGFELTLRLAGTRETPPPTWPMGVMNVIARAGQRALVRGDAFSQDRWRIGVVDDVELRRVETVNGAFGFRQLLVLDEPQFERLTSDSEVFLREYEGSHPRFVND